MTLDNPALSHPLDLYFRHNLWANLLLLDSCATLDEAQLAATAAGTYGSIRATLGHLTFAEERYIFHITKGQQMAGAVRPTADTSLEELRARVQTSSETLLHFATTLDGARQVRVGAGDDAILIPIAFLLLQAIHHGSEHRTHVETILGQLGLDPPGLSGWRYFEEQFEA
jgi:uncharacterized damage-inducible protein DinB